MGGIAYSPDGKYLAVGSSDGTIKVWLMPDGKLISKSKDSSDIRAIRYSSDGKYIVSGNDNKTIKLWSMPDGKLMKAFVGHGNIIWDIDLSQDGKYLVSGGDDKTIKLWSMPDGEQTQAITEHIDRILSVSFSTDSSRLVAGGYDGTLTLLSVSDWKFIKKFAAHKEGVKTIKFSPGGKYFATGSTDGTIKFWPVDENYMWITAMQNTLALARSGEFDKAILEYGKVVPEELSSADALAMCAEFMELLAPVKEKYLKQAKADLAAGKREAGVAKIIKVMRLAGDESEETALRSKLFAAVRRMPVPPAISDEARKEMLRAELDVQSGDFSGAAEAYTKAMNIAPFAAKTYHNLALVYGSLKDYASAKKWMGVYLEAAPEAPDARAAKDEIMKWEILLEKN